VIRGCLLYTQAPPPPPPFRKAENLTVLEKLPTYQYLASVCQLTEAGGVGSVALDVRYCVTVVHAHETAKKNRKTYFINVSICMHLRVRTLDFLKKGQKHRSLLLMCESEL
jgi:hypothetical protein